MSFSDLGYTCIFPLCVVKIFAKYVSTIFASSSNPLSVCLDFLLRFSFRAKYSLETYWLEFGSCILLDATIGIYA